MFLAQPPSRQKAPCNRSAAGFSAYTSFLSAIAEEPSPPQTLSGAHKRPLFLSGSHVRPSPKYPPRFIQRTSFPLNFSDHRRPRQTAQQQDDAYLSFSRCHLHAHVSKPPGSLWIVVLWYQSESMILYFSYICSWTAWSSWRPVFSIIPGNTLETEHFSSLKLILLNKLRNFIHHNHWCFETRESSHRRSSYIGVLPSITL